MHVRPAPRESMRDERDGYATFSPRPVSGLATHRPAFPRVRRSGMIACCRVPFRVVKWTENGRDSAREDRLATCVAVAYRCGGSAGWLVRADSAPCFPFNCARWTSMREHQGAASLRAAQRSVKKAGQCSYADHSRTRSSIRFTGVFNASRAGFIGRKTVRSRFQARFKRCSKAGSQALMSRRI